MGKDIGGMKRFHGESNSCFRVTADVNSYFGIQQAEVAFIGGGIRYLSVVSGITARSRVCRCCGYECRGD